MKTKPTLKLSTLLIVMVVMTSCSSIMHNISKNNKFTDKITSTLFEENGNVFYIKSTYATFSSVWTYKDNDLCLYKLANGKINLVKEYPCVHINNFRPISENELTELDSCMELDGDILGFILKMESQNEKQEFPIGIACFKAQHFNSEFLTKIASDIKQFRIWEVGNASD